tara:strand:- start:698 stop:838 length:141 start_codon:yes stop_codon:yes gene_type:complete
MGPMTLKVNSNKQKKVKKIFLKSNCLTDCPKKAIFFDKLSYFVATY